MPDDEQILIELEPMNDNMRIAPLVDQLTAIIALRAGNVPIEQWPVNLIVLELRCLKAVRFIRSEAPSVSNDEEG